ncbi:MAG TPA: hypothetical protein EYP09_00095 [Anaerolineae bacterium]|nr:hypothetical protein [Anaerolineae bacterium]
MLGLLSWLGVNDTQLPSTQEHILVEAVRDGLIILKTKHLAAVIEVTGRDISRMTDDARIGLLTQYQRFLDTLRFPYQIIVGRKQQSLEEFWGFVDRQAQAWKRRGNSIYADWLLGFAEFMRQVTSAVNPQVHQYLVVLPYDPIPPTERARRKLALTPERLQAAAEELGKRCDTVIRGLARLGLPARRLGDEELVAVLHRVYWPHIPDTAVPPLARLSMMVYQRE